MPVTPGGVTGIVAPNLAATGNIGMGMPQLATGVGIGVSTWTAQIQVVTVDTGTLGVGAGGPLPVIVPPPALLGAMLAGFASFGLLGIMSPLLATGLANGIGLAYLQGLVQTIHPAVGTGAAVAKFVAPPATPTIIGGLASAGMTGPSVAQLGGAIGMALDTVFAALVMPLPIVGAPSPSGGGGAGTGKII